MTAPTGTPGAPSNGGTPTGPAPATGTQQPTTPAPSGQQAPEAQDVSALPPWAQKLINDTRTEAAKHRTDKQTAAQAAADAQSQKAAVLKAFGLKDDGTDDVDPNKLTEQVNQLKAVAWEAAVESNVVRIGHTLGLDVDALLDSNSFLNSLEGLVDEDPGSADFRTKLEEHLKDFAGKNPTKFKAAATPTGPARSGGDMPPGASGNTATRPKSLMDAVRKALPGG